MPISNSTDPDVLRLQLNRAERDLAVSKDENARLEAKVRELAIALQDANLKLREFESKV